MQEKTTGVSSARPWGEVRHETDLSGVHSVGGKVSVSSPYVRVCQEGKARQTKRVMRKEGKMGKKTHRRENEQDNRCQSYPSGPAKKRKKNFRREKGKDEFGPLNMRVAIS